MKTPDSAIHRLNSHLNVESPHNKTTEFVQVHIFPKNYHYSKFSELPSELIKKGFTYQLHQDYNVFQSIIKNKYVDNKKVVCLIEVGQQEGGGNSTIFPKDYYFGDIEENVSIQYYSEQPFNARYPCLYSVEKIMDFCDKNLKRQTQRIQLRSVRSLSTSRQKQLNSYRSAQVFKIAIPVKYQKVFYQIENLGLNEQKSTTFNYQMAVNSLEQMERTKPFYVVEELQSLNL